MNIIVFLKVFSKPMYIAIALCSALTLIIVTNLISAGKLLAAIFFDTSLALVIKTKLFLLFLTDAGETVYSVAFITSALLFGINLALIIYYVQKRYPSSGSSHASFGGAVLAGILGIGCLSCGTLLSTISGTFIGGSALVIVLGESMGFLMLISIVLFLFSIYSTAKKIADPAVCTM